MDCFPNPVGFISCTRLVNGRRKCLEKGSQNLKDDWTNVLDHIQVRQSDFVLLVSQIATARGLLSVHMATLATCFCPVASHYTLQGGES